MTAQVIYLTPKTRVQTARKRKQYHTLLAREHGRWCIAFGAFDRADVDAERADYVDGGWLKKNLHIITTEPDQDEIDYAVAVLNGESV